MSHTMVSRAVVHIFVPFTSLSLISAECSLVHLSLIVEDLWKVCKICDFLNVFFITEPGPIDAPVLLNVKSRTMSIIWQQPVKCNGVITHYNIYQHGHLSFTAPGNVTNYTVVHLRPHTAYQFQVEACTSKGCSKSPESQTVWTLPGTPEGIPSPELFPYTPTSVIVSWQPPTHPSGWAESFTIQRRVKGNKEVRSLVTLPRSRAMKFIDRDPALSPWTQYEYRVLGSSVSGGTRRSEWVEVTTRPCRPAGVQPPRVHVLGPDVVKVRCRALWLLCSPTAVGTYAECTPC